MTPKNASSIFCTNCFLFLIYDQMHDTIGNETPIIFTMLMSNLLLSIYSLCVHNNKNNCTIGITKMAIITLYLMVSVSLILSLAIITIVITNFYSFEFFSHKRRSQTLSSFSFNIIIKTENKSITFYKCYYKRLKW